ncbi:hypothetical protein ACEPAH_3177 [Sanghuangporus vaninii]
MPSLLGRFRFRSNSTSRALKTVQGSNDTDAKGKSGAVRVVNKEQKFSAKLASTNTRLRSWLSLKRYRKQSGPNQPSDRPPTPTPHLALISFTSKDAGPRTLKRVRPPSVDTEIVLDEIVEGREKGDKKASSAESDEGGNGLTRDERIQLESYANGVRGLIAELKNADKETRSTPPMTTEDGTPLSPISEADELEDVPDLHQEIAQQTVYRIPSDDSITELDYGELLDPSQFDDNEKHSDEDILPVWNPDVTDLVESMMSGHREKSLPATPSAPEPDTLNEEGRVDDDSIEHELARDEESASESKILDEAETEDELEYFSAQSIPTSLGEVTPADEITSEPGLHLQGLSLSTASSSDSFDFFDSSDDNEETIEDVTMSSRTPRPSPRRRLPTQTHPMFRPDTIDGPASLGLQRQRANTLPVGRECSLPTLPRLSIPKFVGDEQLTEEVKSPGELMKQRTVARLQREKTRLEQALATASNKIEQQDGYIAALEAQISKLHAALVRFARGDAQALTSTVNQEHIPIVVRAPEEPAKAEGSVEHKSSAGTASATGLITPDSSTASKGGLNTLSTPPASPDRRAAAALSEGASVGNDGLDGQDMDLLRVLKPAQGLNRRNSAGAASASSDLRVGRAQVSLFKIRRKNPEGLSHHILLDSRLNAREDLRISSH